MLVKKVFNSVWTLLNASSLAFKTSPPIAPCCTLWTPHVWKGMKGVHWQIQLKSKWLPSTCEYHYSSVFMRPNVTAINACQPKVQFALIWLYLASFSVLRTTFWPRNEGNLKNNRLEVVACVSFCDLKSSCLTVNNDRSKEFQLPLIVIMFISCC